MLMWIGRVGHAELADLVPMLRAYCDFYEVDPSDDALQPNWCGRPRRTT
jgi:hypothetical protein